MIVQIINIICPVILLICIIFNSMTIIRLRKSTYRLSDDIFILNTKCSRYKAALYEISKSGCDLDHDICRACVAVKALRD